MVFLKKLWNKESGVVMTTKIYDHDIKLTKDAVINDKILRGVYDREVELYEIAFEEGVEKGREEGRAEGREEDIATGIEKVKIDVAKGMKKQGFSLETICGIIKVPMDTVSSWSL